MSATADLTSATLKAPISKPKLLLHAEGLATAAIACFAFYELNVSWILFAVLFLAPDISMLGYCLGSKIGAWAYNAAHTYIGPLLLGLVAYKAGWAPVLPICAIWLAHIGADRLLGFGLKYETRFKDTHLNRV